MAIPKKIHYIWLGGGEMSQSIKDCMSTWSKVCPDYEIIAWNEHNYDMTQNQLIKNAVRAQNWALAADIMRVEILLKHGGIYLDTDVELIKPFDDLLEYSFFIGYESKLWCNNAIIGSQANHSLLKHVLAVYNIDATVDKHTNLMCVHTYSAVLQYFYGLKPDGKTRVLDGGIAVYSQEYFYSMHWLTRKTRHSNKSICIHRCANAWLDDTKRIKMKLIRIFRRVLTKYITNIFEAIYVRGLYRRCRARIIKVQELEISPTDDGSVKVW
ncbi:MAG: hypothetical protein FWF56_05450 [Firmicutes bacterium]|nr:hypothetical protein [Bacillota bacterium]MCL1953860.1 hypothetical protein [Bacillota bacterium]